MDEIKNVIQDLPAQDISILKSIYNPELAKADLSPEGQRVSAILESLSEAEQQEAVDVAIQASDGEPEQNQEKISEEQQATDQAVSMEAPNEGLPENVNPVGSLEDYLI